MALKSPISLKLPIFSPVKRDLHRHKHDHDTLPPQEVHAVPWRATLIECTTFGKLLHHEICGYCVTTAIIEVLCVDATSNEKAVNTVCMCAHNIMLQGVPNGEDVIGVEGHVIEGQLVYDRIWLSHDVRFPTLTFIVSAQTSGHW